MATAFTFTDATASAAATTRTYLQMKQAVRRRVRNTTLSTSAPELDDFFDDAREWLGTYTFESMKSTQIVTTVKDQAEYNLTDRLASIYVVKFTTDIEKYLFPKTLEEIDRNDPNPSTTTYPNFYYMNGAQVLGLYLTPSTAGKKLSVRGYKELLKLSGDSDVWPLQIIQIGMQYVYARWLEYDKSSKAGPALAELFHPLTGRPGPMLSRFLIKDRRTAQIHYIAGGRRGISTQTLLLDGNFPPVW